MRRRTQPSLPGEARVDARDMVHTSATAVVGSSSSKKRDVDEAVTAVAGKAHAVADLSRPDQAFEQPARRPRVVEVQTHDPDPARRGLVEDG